MPGLPADSPPAFELEHVCVERDGRTLLNDVSLCLPSGGFTALIGPSGAGKTTLLRLLNRLDETTSGKVKHHDLPSTPA
jgi:putative ABC transport system ATP-binding protein